MEDIYIRNQRVHFKVWMHTTALIAQLCKETKRLPISISSQSRAFLRSHSKKVPGIQMFSILIVTVPGRHPAHYTNGSQLSSLDTDFRGCGRRTRKNACLFIWGWLRRYTSSRHQIPEGWCTVSTPHEEGGQRTAGRRAPSVFTKSGRYIHQKWKTYARPEAWGLYTTKTYYPSRRNKPSRTIFCTIHLSSSNQCFLPDRRKLAWEDWERENSR